MKRFTIFLICALAVLSASSCKKTSEGLTGITYYAVITLTGDNLCQVTAGSTWVDPGYSATLKGEDVTDKLDVSELDTTTPGIKTITYSIVNEDGFPAKASRKVLVVSGDPIEGIYKVDPESYRIYGGNKVAYGNSYTVLIYKDQDGTYAVDDMFGGWYRDRAGYGNSYAMQGSISLTGKDITLEESYLASWEDSIVELTNGKFDADKGSISWAAEYASGMMFYVKMQKQE